jgi:hypothetical protein
LEQEDLSYVVTSPFVEATQPVTATCLGRIRLIGEQATGDIEHIVLHLPQGMQHIEGQSISIPLGLSRNGNHMHHDCIVLRQHDNHCLEYELLERCLTWLCPVLEAL